MKRIVIVFALLSLVPACAQEKQQEAKEQPKPGEAQEKAAPKQEEQKPEERTFNADPPPRKVGGEVSPPKVKYAPDPKYSKEARRKRIEGRSVLWVVVGKDGLPHNMRVVRAVGYGLDEEAINAVRKWRFEPARLKDGTPVDVQINVEINFRCCP